MDQEQQDGQQPRWQPTRKQLLWAGGITTLAFLLIVICGYLFGWKWTGLVAGANYPKKTLWDWLDLLIVPFVLAVGGYLFNRTESRRTQETSDQQRALDRQIADERGQDDTLQAYLDGMSQLLTDEKRPLHRAQLGDSLSTVARARTLTVLGRLDSGRKRSVLELLYESRLIDQEQAPYVESSDLIERRHNIIRLKEAYLSEANLSQTHLPRANLPWTNLSGAVLSEADLHGANLHGANLSEANLRGAKGVANEQLSAARSLEGATMPDGQTLRGGKMPNRPTLEDWIKDKKARRGDEKNE